MDSNLDKLAAAFAVDKLHLVAAVKRFPPLAYQEPDRLIEAADTLAGILGASRSEVIEAAIRNPSILMRKPGGYARRMRLVLRIAHHFGANETKTGILGFFPAALTYGYDRLLQRYAVARLGLWTWDWSTLLTFSDEKIRERLRDYFTGRPEQKGLRRALERRSLL